LEGALANHPCRAQASVSLGMRRRRP